MNKLNQEIFSALKQRDLNKVIGLVKIGLSADKHNWQGFHVEIANQMIALFPWNLVRSLLPKGILHFYESGWLRSTQEGKPFNLKGEPIPWFSYPAIDFLDDMVNLDMTVFEWGSGNSTLWWSKRVNTVFSIEDNALWFESLKTDLPVNAKTIFAQNDTYIHAISKIGKKFDVIVIDGSYRNACLEQAKKYLKDKGFIVFDNSDRNEHQNGFAQLKAEGWHRIDFWGLSPSFCYKNCTSIIFRDLAAISHQKAPSQHNSSTDISCSQAIERN